MCAQASRTDDFRSPPNRTVMPVCFVLKNSPFPSPAQGSGSRYRSELSSGTPSRDLRLPPWRHHQMVVTGQPPGFLVIRGTRVGAGSPHPVVSS